MKGAFFALHYWSFSFSTAASTTARAKSITVPKRPMAAAMISASKTLIDKMRDMLYYCHIDFVVSMNTSRVCY